MRLSVLPGLGQAIRVTLEAREQQLKVVLKKMPTEALQPTEPLG